jgi:hypothetical protein
MSKESMKTHQQRKLQNHIYNLTRKAIGLLHLVMFVGYVEHVVNM